MDMVSVAQEITHVYNTSKSMAFLLKLYFENAYDRVEWDCLLEILMLLWIL